MNGLLVWVDRWRSSIRWRWRMELGYRLHRCGVCGRRLIGPGWRYLLIPERDGWRRAWRCERHRDVDHEGRTVAPFPHLRAADDRRVVDRRRPIDRRT